MPRPMKELPIDSERIEEQFRTAVLEWLAENDRSITWLMRKTGGGGETGSWLWRSLKDGRPFRLREAAAIAAVIELPLWELMLGPKETL